jgi:hypothetical protein
MAINHRINRLERHAPRPPQACPHCGIAQLNHGTGTVRPGWLLPEQIGEESRLLGCKNCFAWVRVDHMPTPNADGSYTLVGAVRCGPPEYI